MTTQQIETITDNKHQCLQSKQQQKQENLRSLVVSHIIKNFYNPQQLMSSTNRTTKKQQEYSM